MNLLDLGILIILFLVGLRGYYRGLFQEISVIVGILIGIVVAAHEYPRLASILSPLIKNPLYSQVISFLVILIAVYWLTRFVGLLLQRLLVFLFLERLDHFLGGIFGVAKGMLILGFVLTMLHTVIPKDSRLLSESWGAPHLESFFDQALKVLPPNFTDRLKQEGYALLKQWNRPSDAIDSSEEEPNDASEEPQDSLEEDPDSSEKSNNSPEGSE